MASLSANSQLRTYDRLSGTLRIEDSTQFLALRRMGCDIGQGYYFGPPMPAQDMERLLSDELAAAKTAATTG